MILTSTQSVAKAGCLWPKRSNLPSTQSLITSNYSSHDVSFHPEITKINRLVYIIAFSSSVFWLLRSQKKRTYNWDHLMLNLSWLGLLMCKHPPIPSSKSTEVLGYLDSINIQDQLLHWGEILLLYACVNVHVIAQNIVVKDAMCESLIFIPRSSDTDIWVIKLPSHLKAQYLMTSVLGESHQAGVSPGTHCGVWFLNRLFWATQLNSVPVWITALSDVIPHAVWRERGANSNHGLTSFSWSAVRRLDEFLTCQICQSAAIKLLGSWRRAASKFPKINCLFVPLLLWGRGNRRC